MCALDAARLAGEVGLDPDRARLRAVGGGSIGAAVCLYDDAGQVFIKTLPEAQRAVLGAERDGLARLAAAGAIVTPAVVGDGVLDKHAWLALEWLDLAAPDRAGFARLGTGLAALHANTAGKHGLEHDNFLGASRQRNRRSADWTEFLFECRLGPQLDRANAVHDGFDDARDRLERAWTARFDGYRPPASLLHGDLWCGNVGRLDDGQPVVFDPAVHYGDRECDLAMAALFGGFDAEFEDAYRGVWPLDPGWTERRGFYQLYHLLNHANLFGGGYVARCRSLIDTLS